MVPSPRVTVLQRLALLQFEFTRMLSFGLCRLSHSLRSSDRHGLSGVFRRPLAVLNALLLGLPLSLNLSLDLGWRSGR